MIAPFATMHLQQLGRTRTSRGLWHTCDGKEVQAITAGRFPFVLRDRLIQPGPCLHNRWTS